MDARFHAPTRVAFRIRNGVGTRDKTLCEAQWLACVLLYRRFAAALTGDCARLEADMVSYSFIVYRTCTDYSLPVSRRTAKESGHYRLASYNPPSGRLQPGYRTTIRVAVARPDFPADVTRD